MPPDLISVPVTLDAVVTADAAGGYTATIPALLGCQTRGGTPLIAAANVGEAAAAWLAAAHGRATGRQPDRDAHDRVWGQYKASLRFFGDDLDPAEVTRMLGGSPTHSVRRGERSATFPDTNRRPSPTGRWLRNSGLGEGEPLDRHVAALFAGLTDDLDVWRALTARHKADVFCGVFMHAGNVMYALEPATTMLLASRGIPLCIDAYDFCPPAADGPITSGGRTRSVLEYAREYAVLPPDQQARALAMLAHGLTNSAPASPPPDGGPWLSDPTRIRAINRVQRDVTSHLLALLGGDDRRYQDDVFVSILLDHPDDPAFGQRVADLFAHALTAVVPA